MNPRGPGARTLTLLLLASIALLLWQRAEYCSSAADSAVTEEATGFVRLPWTPRSSFDLTSPADPAYVDWQPVLIPYLAPEVDLSPGPPGYADHVGQVLNGDTGEGILGAHIHVENRGGRFGNSAKRHGSFRVSAAPGLCDVSFSAQGFETRVMHDLMVMERWDYGAVRLNPIRRQMLIQVLDSSGDKADSCRIALLDPFGYAVPTSVMGFHNFAPGMLEFDAFGGVVNVYGLNSGAYEAHVQMSNGTKYVAKMFVPAKLRKNQVVFLRLTDTVVPEVHPAARTHE